jgi:hypothetical protein
LSNLINLDDVVQAAISYNNYDLQQKAFAAKTNGLFDPRAKEIYAKLEKRLNDAIIDYVQTNTNLS